MEAIKHSQGILGHDEALGFLEKNLGISDAKDLLSNNPVTLLDRIAHHYTEAVPFQNLTILSASIGTLDVPDIEKIKSERMAGRGGLCYGNNLFLCELVCALGFKAYMARGTVVNPGSHPVVIVTTMPSGDTGESYLLDHGIPLALGKAVPLNFEGESPVCDLGHSIYKFKRDGDTYTRFTAKRGKIYISSSEFSNPDTIFEWKRTFSFNTDPIDVAALPKMVEVPYTKYFGTFGNLLFSICRGEVLHIIEDFDKSTTELSIKHHEMRPSGTVSSRLRSVDDIVACFTKILTAYSEEELRKTMENLVYYKMGFVQQNGIREKTSPENDCPV